MLHVVESLTNPGLRNEVGDVRLVRPQDRMYGDGASWIMAAFVRPPVDGRGGRFNRDFGVATARLIRWSPLPGPPVFPMKMEHYRIRRIVRFQ